MPLLYSRHALNRTVASLATASALTLSLLCFTKSAHADFILDPTGGTALVFADPDFNDDENVFRSLGGTFNFYGIDLTEFAITTNGYLVGGPTTPGAFTADRGIGALATAEGFPVIAPLYDDLFLDATLGNSITEKVVAGQYYAVTYSIAGFNDITPGTDSNFQTLLFTGDTTLSGFSFLAGDIAISYAALNSSITDTTATVGVGLDSTNFTALPGTTDGQITDFSLLPTGNQFLLFRPEQLTGGAVTYSVSIEQTGGVAVAAPEPGSIALFLTAGVPIVGIVRRHKSRKQRD